MTQYHHGLIRLMEYVDRNSKYYQRIFKSYNIQPNQIRTIRDLEKIPFTTKDDLALYNDEFLCVAKNQIADFVTTSGTLSDPVAFYLTENDLNRLAMNEAMAFQRAGCTEEDIFQLMTTIDRRFMAGLAYWTGARKLGAGMIRVGPGAPFLQWESILRFSPTVLIAIPSFIPRLIDYAIENQIEFRKTSIRSIICIGEPIRNPDFSLNALGKRICDQWDVQLYSTYASTEMGAAFTECSEGKGGHLNPDLLILEVIDEEGQHVRDGALGEVAVTTLSVEGMPLLRYKTGDLCHVHYGSCACGSSSPRLGPVVGRKQQMIKYKGTTVFPPAIYDILDTVKEIELYQVVVSVNEFGNDEITILLDTTLKGDLFSEKLNSLFKSRLRVTPQLNYISKEELYGRVFRQEKRKPEKLVYAGK